MLEQIVFRASLSENVKLFLLELPIVFLPV